MLRRSVVIEDQVELGVKAGERVDAVKHARAKRQEADSQPGPGCEARGGCEAEGRGGRRHASLEGTTRELAAVEEGRVDRVVVFIALCSAYSISTGRFASWPRFVFYMFAARLLYAYSSLFRGGSLYRHDISLLFVLLHTYIHA